MPSDALVWTVMLTFLRRTRPARLVLAAVCLGVMALFAHASSCAATEDVATPTHAPASATATALVGNAGPDAPQQCGHSEHAVLQTAAPSVHAPDSALLLLGLVTLVTCVLCLGVRECLYLSPVVDAERPVPLAGRGLLTRLCISRT